MNKLDVFYGDEPVGTLAIVRGGIYFEYAASFVATGHELSPLALPLGSGIRSRDPQPSLRLPGLFEDSLPDSWGTRLMDDWFRRQGTPPHAVDPLMRLSFLGKRTFGALTYAPAEGVETGTETLDTIYAAAAQAAASEYDDARYRCRRSARPRSQSPQGWFQTMRAASCLPMSKPAR